MGNEIKRDVCPPKYCRKSSVITETLPTALALILVALFSGNLFAESGMDTVVTVVIEVVFVVLLYGLIVLLFNGMKKRLAATYISLCENGLCGECQAGFKNRQFTHAYTDIQRMAVKRERLFLYPASGGVIALTLEDAEGTAAVIRSKNPAIP